MVRPHTKRPSCPDSSVTLQVLRLRRTRLRMQQAWPSNDPSRPLLYVSVGSESCQQRRCAFQWLFDASKCSLRSNCSSKCHRIVVVPIVPRLRRCAGEHPQPDTFVIDAKQIRKASDRSFWVRSQSRRAVEQELRRVVGGISDEGLCASRRCWTSHCTSCFQNYGPLFPHGIGEELSD